MLVKHIEKNIREYTEQFDYFLINKNKKYIVYRQQIKKTPNNRIKYIL